MGGIWEQVPPIFLNRRSMNIPTHCLASFVFTVALVSATEPSEDANPNANEEFLALARASSAGSSSEQVPVPTKGVHLGNEVPEGCRYAYSCIRQINDRGVASAAYALLAERLREEGFYKEALEIVRLIPDHRRPLAAAELVLSIPPGTKGIDPNVIVDELVRKHSLSLTYRQKGELLIRLAQWYARVNNTDQLESTMAALRNLPTLEYLARAQARVGIERARRGEPVEFEKLLDGSTQASLLGRNLPDFNYHIGGAQVEIAVLLYDEAKTEDAKKAVRELFRKSMATASSSRVFAGDVLVRCCKVLTDRGETELAEEIFRKHAPQISDLSNSVSTKPLILARLAPIYQRWSPDFDPNRLLKAAEQIAELQHPVNRARSFAAIGSAWQSLGKESEAFESWSRCLGIISGITNDRPRYNVLAHLALEMSLSMKKFPDTLGDQLKKLKPS